MTFDEWIQKVADRNPAGISDTWERGARAGWNARESYGPVLAAPYSEAPAKENPFEPKETTAQQDARVGRMIRENVDKKLAEKG